MSQTRHGRAFFFCRTVCGVQLLHIDSLIIRRGNKHEEIYNLYSFQTRLIYKEEQFNSFWH